MSVGEYTPLTSVLHAFEDIPVYNVVLNILLKLVTRLSTTLQGAMKTSQGCHNNVVGDLDMTLGCKLLRII